MGDKVYFKDVPVGQLLVGRHRKIEAEPWHTTGAFISCRYCGCPW